MGLELELELEFGPQRIRDRHHVSVVSDCHNSAFMQGLTQIRKDLGYFNETVTLLFECKSRSFDLLKPSN